MKKKPRRTFQLALCLAAMMHLWLFTGFRPVDRNGLLGAPVPPDTYYIARSSNPSPMQSDDIRTVWSPVLFSLPSELGFSRELLREKVHTRLTFRQPDEPEYYLAVSSAPRDNAARVIPGDLLISAAANPVLPPPSASFTEENRRAGSRRVYVAPELRARLVGGIVLPPELNQTGEAAWEVHADISISKQGDVQHVFLEQPLEMEALNLEVIRMLHGLRFQPGEGSLDGRIEIYSPEALPGEGVTP